jgi:hypothetical protein
MLERKAAERLPRPRRAHHVVGLRICWRSGFSLQLPHREKRLPASGSGEFLPSTVPEASSANMHRRASSVRCDGYVALSAQVLGRHIEHKNEALAQVVERFCAFWIGAMVHHAIFSPRRPSPLGRHSCSSYSPSKLSNSALLYRCVHGMQSGPSFMTN